MPQNTKDNNGGKTHKVKDTSPNGGKHPEKDPTGRKSDSPTGSQNKGEKKTTP